MILPPLRRTQREIARVIHDESLRMGRLVRDLLDLARMEAGHIRLEPSTVNVPELIRRVYRKFQTISREEQVVLQVDLPTGWIPFGGMRIKWNRY